MEHQLLEAVLGGQVELSAVLAWALGEEGEAPLPERHSESPWRSPRRTLPPSRPADFRVHVLNAVRDQAELVLAAAEQEAAGGSGSSHPPTLQPTNCGNGGVGIGEDSSSADQAQTAAAPTAATPPRQRRASSGGGGSTGGTGGPPQWPIRAAGSQLQRQRQQPGRLDDDNFPTLAAAAAAGSSGGGGRRQSGGGGAWGSPAKAQPAQNAGQQGQQQRQVRFACMWAGVWRYTWPDLDRLTLAGSSTRCFPRIRITRLPLPAASCQPHCNGALCHPPLPPGPTSPCLLPPP